VAPSDNSPLVPRPSTLNSRPSGLGFAIAEADLKRGYNVVGNAVAPGIIDTPLHNK